MRIKKDTNIGQCAGQLLAQNNNHNDITIEETVVDPAMLQKKIKEEKKVMVYEKELILIEECFKQEVTDVDPQNDIWKTKGLSKAQLEGLCTKLELENDCQKLTRKKFSALSRMAQSEFLITKIKRLKVLADRLTRDIFDILDVKPRN
mmetsp:Transcript_16056/g.15416  ORF Transcript_16056/g.15416 Transcript_16056/m.15416 type:complete len:148 (+) Transcript_16056:325-768(+)